jgi:biotin carboxyl carrier protein
MRWTIVIDGEVFEIEIGAEGRASVNQQPYEVDLRAVGGQYSLLIDHRSYEVHVSDSVGDACCVTVEGKPFQARLQRGARANGRAQLGPPDDDIPSRRARTPSTSVEMRAPLPGLLVELHVSEGDNVEEEDVVAILESMKMNLELRAPRGGAVRELRVLPGRRVSQDEVLAIIDPNGGSRCDGAD